MLKKIFILITICCTVSACGLVELVTEVIKENPEILIPATPTPQSTSTAAPTPTNAPTALPTSVPTVVATASPHDPPKGTNPVCGTKELPSRAHLLWKPVSDTSGNAVIVFDGKYKEEFLEVTMQLKAGGVESAFWKGLQLWGNPDRSGPRQHWRLRKKCADYKSNGLITAKDSVQTCVFKLEGPSCNRIE